MPDSAYACRVPSQWVCRITVGPSRVLTNYMRADLFKLDPNHCGEELQAMCVASARSDYLESWPCSSCFTSGWCRLSAAVASLKGVAIEFGGEELIVKMNEGQMRYGIDRRLRTTLALT